MRSTFLVAAVCAPLAGCLAPGVAKPEVDAAVSAYRAQYNAGQFAEIYRASDPELKQAQGEQDFTRLLALAHRKLGPVEQAEQVGYHIDARVGTNGGTRVTVTYRTRFAEGEAAETLLWRIRGGKAKLLAFNVNSPLLLEDAPPARPAGVRRGADSAAAR